jgi:tRNA-splicing ligase RtcB
VKHSILWYIAFGSILLNLYFGFGAIPIANHIIEVQEETIDQILGDFARLCKEAKTEQNPSRSIRSLYKKEASMPYQVLGGARVPVKVYVESLSDVESSALDQLRNTANLPWVLGVSGMPDVHWGNGATVGSVIVQRDALAPSVVGVDIGCGMCAVLTPLKASQLKDLPKLRHSIERSVPVGFNSNSKISENAKRLLLELGRPSERASDGLYQRATEQLGSLGGGNHFIEICLDKEPDPNVWVMLHSGSRNIGKELAELHIRKAKGLMGELVRKFGEMVIPEELAALVVGTPEYEQYLEDLFWCQRFAKANRDEMMVRVLKDLSHHVLGEDKGPGFMTLERVDCHHNYVSREDTPLGNGLLVTRKGAVSARIGEMGIIPGSMGARSFIVRGKGNPDSFCSCSHGAGRKMSRGKAKKTFTVADMKLQTEGVECRKDAGVLDEIPGAYKDIEQVMRNQSDLVEVAAELKQVLCVKG